ncbi:MAG: response regulator [Oligoflexales bacterium]
MAKILVVDDSLTIRTNLSSILKKLGHEVVMAKDGIEGLSQLKENPDCALAFVDVHMPELDGLAMIKEINENPDTYSSLPIVVLTTENNQHKIAVGKSYGATAWCLKPASPDQIATIVDKLIDS